MGAFESGIGIPFHFPDLLNAEIRVSAVEERDSEFGIAIHGLRILQYRRVGHVDLTNVLDEFLPVLMNGCGRSVRDVSQHFIENKTEFVDKDIDVILESEVVTRD